MLSFHIETVCVWRWNTLGPHLVLVIDSKGTVNMVLGGQATHLPSPWVVMTQQPEEITTFNDFHCEFLL